VLAYVFVLIVGTQVDHNDTRALSRTPVDEVSARRRDFCLAANITYTRQTSTPPASVRRPIALDRAATELGDANYYSY